MESAQGFALACGDSIDLVFGSDGWPVEEPPWMEVQHKKGSRKSSGSSHAGSTTLSHCTEGLVSHSTPVQNVNKPVHFEVNVEKSTLHFRDS
jgi:hypothetical protein